MHAALIALRDDKENVSQTFEPNDAGYQKFRRTAEGQRVCLPVSPSVYWKGSGGWPTGRGHGMALLMSLPPQE